MTGLMLNSVQDLITWGNRTLKLNQRLMGLRPKVQGDDYVILR